MRSDSLIDWIFDPPDPVVELSPWGIAGNLFLLVLGLAILCALIVLTERRDLPFWVLLLIPLSLTMGAETSFLRAIGPDSATAERWLFAGFIALGGLLFVVVARMTFGAESAGLAAGVACVAAVLAFVFDAVATQMSLVPISLGVILVFGGAMFAYTRD